MVGRFRRKRPDPYPSPCARSPASLGRLVGSLPARRRRVGESDLLGPPLFRAGARNHDRSRSFDYNCAHGQMNQASYVTEFTQQKDHGFHPWLLTLNPFGLPRDRGKHPNVSVGNVCIIVRARAPTSRALQGPADIVFAGLDSQPRGSKARGFQGAPYNAGGGTLGWADRLTAEN